MARADDPPAWLNEPPTYTWPLLLSAIARTIPGSDTPFTEFVRPFVAPLPSVCQAEPFHSAMPFAATPPMVVKVPPTYTPPGPTATAFTAPSRSGTPKLPAQV